MAWGLVSISLNNETGTPLPAIGPSQRRSPALAAVFLLASTSFLAVILPGPAAAYPAMDSAFAGGSAQANLTFGPGHTTLAGPSLRLLTNSTVSSAQVDVSGALGYAPAFQTRDTTADFAAANTLESLTPAAGALSLNAGSAAYWLFDASNNFGGGTFSSTAIVNGALVLNQSNGGNYISPAVSNPGEGWGYFTAAGSEDFGSNVTFNLLDGGGGRVLPGIEPGALIPFTSWEQPALSVEVVLTLPNLSRVSEGPSVTWFAIGERESDQMFGSGVARSPNNMEVDGGAARTLPEPANLTKLFGNPVIAKVAATYRSAFVGQPMVLRVGSEWWMYFTASTTGDYTDANIARAVSTDLNTWTVDAAPVLQNGASGFDAYGIDNPYVMRNGTEFIMFYNGWTSATACSIGRASSPDGINWTKEGEVVAPSASGWDSYAVGMVSRVALADDGSSWTMWYSGTDVTTGGGFSFGMATSPDGYNWSKFFANPLLTRTPGGPDQDDLRGGKQLAVGRSVYYYYSCNNAVRYNICLASSQTGGVTWVKVGAVLNVSAFGWDSQHVADPGVALTDSAFFVFYSGYQSGQAQIGRASASFRAGSYTGRFDLLAGGAPNLATFTKDPVNPKLRTGPSTYYSTFVGQPSILRVNGVWTMYFTAGNGSGYSIAGIARAISADLSSWSVLDDAPVVRPNASQNDSYAAANPYVLPDPMGTGFIMYYSGWSTAYQPRVMRATSPDGFNWTKTGEVLKKSAFGWDSFGVGMVSRVEYDASSALWKLWYSGTASSSGGGNALGYATSFDGINWTKYAGNPVMQRGGSGEPDQTDAQGGKMIRVGENLVYYYSCNDGNTYHACLAVSPDGLAWSKAGFVLNDSTSGWDSFQVSDPMPVVAGSSFYLFFAATNGPYAQIGRATGVWNPVTDGTGPRLADLPRSFTRFAANTTAGSGATVSYTLRSSADGVVWSTPEPVTAGDPTIATPVRRFVEFTANFSSAGARSALASGSLFLTSSIDQGRYVDSAFSFVDPVDQVRLSASVLGAGAIDWSVSSDGGLAWAPLLPGTSLDISGEPLQLALEGRFRGFASAGPLLDGLVLEARTHGYPSDVGVRPGSTGTRIVVAAGPLLNTVTITIPPDDLTAAIDAALAMDLGATSVDVPLVVDSSHFGVVSLSAPELRYTLKNPLVAIFDPGVPEVTVAEGTSTSFSIAASTLAGVALNYSWRLDGVLQASTNSSYTYSADFAAAGPHTVDGTVENGDFTQSWTWNVMVTNVNRPPTIVASPPSSTITQSYRQAANFSVAASDPDGEVLDYQWRLDGRLQAGTAPNFTTAGVLPEGTHFVQVNVSDGLATVSAQWTLTLTNSPPLASFTPSANVTLAHTENVTLVAAAADADGDLVEYGWKVDGAVQTTANSTFLVWRPTTGSHTVEVNVYAGGQLVSHAWQIVSTNAAPVVLTRTPAADIGNNSNASQSFAVDVVDPEGDAISYGWTLDGVRQNATGRSLDVPAGLPAGPHIVSLTITDALGAATKENWTFEIPPPSKTPPPAATGNGFLPGFDAVAVAGALCAAAGLGGARGLAPRVPRGRGKP